MALGRALLSGPRLLLMDEPLASLDAALKARVLAYLQRVAAEWSIPTLFVSHSQAEVRRVNLLRLEGAEIDGGHATGRIGDQLLYLPLQQAPKDSPLLIQFSPADVTLSRQDVAGLSTRNHLRGRVCQLVSLDQAVFVAVDIGQILWAEVTPDAAAELELQPGREVFCLLKAHSLRVVD